MLPRSLPYLTTALLLAGMIAIILSPKFLLPIAVSAVLVFGLAQYLISGQRLWSLTFWALFVTPFWLLVSSFGMLAILESPMIRWALALGIPFVEGFYLRQLFLYHRAPENYQPYALEHFSSALNIIVAFLAFSSLYGLKLFLGLGWALLVPLCVSLVVTLTYQTFWVQKMSERRALLWILIIGIVIPEVFVSLGFLPTSHLVNGLIMAIFFYLAVVFSRSVLKQSLERKTLLREFGVGFGLVTLVLLTARWV